MWSRFFPMSRIVSRNGLRYDNPGSTRGAEEHKKSGHMTAKNPVYNSIFKNGAKETRTPDPLQTMQLVRSCETPSNNSKKPCSTGISAKPDSNPTKPARAICGEIALKITLSSDHLHGARFLCQSAAHGKTTSRTCCAESTALGGD